MNFSCEFCSVPIWPFLHFSFHSNSGTSASSHYRINSSSTVSSNTSNTRKTWIYGKSRLNKRQHRQASVKSESHSSHPTRHRLTHRQCMRQASFPSHQLAAAPIHNYLQLSRQRAKQRNPNGLFCLFLLTSWSLRWRRETIAARGKYLMLENFPMNSTNFHEHPSRNIKWFIDE